jgi:hypothetical protein
VKGTYRDWPRITRLTPIAEPAALVWALYATLLAVLAVLAAIRTARRDI